MNEVKRCTECLVEKPIAEFHNKTNSKTGKVGKTAKCKSCIYEKTKAWRKKNAEKHREDSRVYRAKWRAKNPERNKETQRQGYYRNREIELERMRKWRADNPEKVKAATKAWRERNRDHHLETLKAWRDRNKAHRDEYRKYYYEFVRRFDENYKAQMKMRQPIYDYMASITGRISGYQQRPLSYSPEDLRQHLESLFAEGMSWINYGEWEVDHIKPISYFVKNGIEDLEIVHALSNIQPLWRIDNLKKASRMPD